MTDQARKNRRRKVALRNIEKYLAMPDGAVKRSHAQLRKEAETLRARIAGKE